MRRTSSMSFRANSLYEAVAQGLRAFRENDWVNDIDGGLTTITVVLGILGLSIKVRVRDFERWLESQGRSPGRNEPQEPNTGTRERTKRTRVNGAWCWAARRSKG